LAIKKNVWVLGIVSLLTDVSSEMIFSVLPVFMSGVLMLDKSVIGLIEGLAEASSSVFKLASERISKILGSRKRTIILGYGISTVLKPLFAFATTWWMVLLVRFGDRAGKGLRGPARDAIIADSSEEGNRGVSFGLHRSMDTLGAIIGPVAAFLILSAFADAFELVFMLSFIPAALAVAVIWLFVKKTDGIGRVKKAKTIKAGKYRWFLGSAAIFALANISFAFLIIRVQELGLPMEYAPLAYLAFTVPYAISAVPFGRLADMFGRINAISLSLVLFIIVFAGLAMTNDIRAGIVLLVIYGIGTAGVDTVQRIIASELVPRKRRVGSLGTYQGLSGLLALPASVIAGSVWSVFGAGYAFALSSLLCFLSLLATQKLR
jgi:MFS family permease